MPSNNPREIVTASRRIYDGRILNLREDSVRLHDGREALREIVEHAEVVAIVPVDADGNVVLVRQYRLAADEALLEIPAGGVEPGESIEDAAQRELQEETGYRAADLRRLCGFYVSPGYVTEFIHVFLGSGLSESAINGDPDEQIVVERVPLSGVPNLIQFGAIKDAKTIAGLLMASKALSA